MGSIHRWHMRICILDNLINITPSQCLTLLSQMGKDIMELFIRLSFPLSPIKMNI